MKFIKHLSLPMAALLLSCTVACGKSAQTGGLPENYTRLYGFENYSEFMSITQAEYLGRYRLNTDKRYVKKGNSSVKIEVSGYGNGTDRPGLYMRPDLMDGGREDFSKAERVVVRRI